MSRENETYLKYVESLCDPGKVVENECGGDKTLLKEQQKQQQTMMQGLIKNKSNDSFLLIDMSLNIGGG